MAIEHGSGNVEPVSQFLHTFIGSEQHLQNLFFTICQGEVVAELPKVEFAVRSRRSYRVNRGGMRICDIGRRDIGICLNCINKQCNAGDYKNNKRYRVNNSRISGRNQHHGKPADTYGAQIVDGTSQSGPELRNPGVIGQAHEADRKINRKDSGRQIEDNAGNEDTSVDLQQNYADGREEHDTEHEQILIPFTDFTKQDSGTDSAKCKQQAGKTPEIQFSGCMQQRHFTVEGGKDTGHQCNGTGKKKSGTQRV